MNCMLWTCWSYWYLWPFFFYLIFTCPALKRNDKMLNEKIPLGWPKTLLRHSGLMAPLTLHHKQHDDPTMMYTGWLHDDDVDDDDVMSMMMMMMGYDGYRIETEIVMEGKDKSRPQSKMMPRDISFTRQATWSTEDVLKISNVTKQPPPKKNQPWNQPAPFLASRGCRVV